MALKALGYTPLKGEVKSIMSNLPKNEKNQHDSISYQEFISVASEKIVSINFSSISIHYK